MIYQRPRGTASAFLFFFVFTKEALSLDEGSVILPDTERCDPRGPLCLVEASGGRHLQGKASPDRCFDACQCVFEE